jgi:stalled ribosome rescue protein Dom34
MTAQTRAAVWVDHQQARIFHVDLGSFDEKTVSAPAHHFHRHPKGSTEPHEHPDDMVRFFREIAQALTSAGEILVMGPSTAKTQLIKYLEEHARDVASKITAVETSDHLTDPQLVAHVRRHFRIAEPRVK